MIRMTLVALPLALLLLLQGCAHKQLFDAAQSYATASRAVLPRVSEARVLAASVDASLPEKVSEGAIDSQVIAEGCKRAVGPLPSTDAVLLRLYAESLTTLSTTPDDSFAALIASLESELPRAAGVHESVAAVEKAHAHNMDACKAYAASLGSPQQYRASQNALRGMPYLGVAPEESVKKVFDLLKALVAAAETERRAKHLRRMVNELKAGTGAAGLRLRAQVAVDLDAAMAGGLWIAEQQRAAAPAGPLPRSGNAEAAQALRNFGLAYRLRNALLVESDGVPGALVALEGLHGKLVEAVQQDRRLSFDDLKAIRAFVEDVRKKVSEL